YRTRERFTGRTRAPEGWEKFNEHYWRLAYADFARFFFERVFPEPHSTRQIEDGVAWALETTPDVLIDTIHARLEGDDAGEGSYSRIRCPVLVIHGDRDEVVPHGKGVRVAELCGGRLLTMEGSGHAPHARHPARVNLLIREFIE